MDDLRDFIDPDEGYRDIDWGSMPGLASHSEAQQISNLAAWYLYEWFFFNLLAEAGFSMLDIELCMTMEAA